MGQQQVLLILVGTIVVCIMVVVGISLFVDSASESNRQEIYGDLLHYGTLAQGYYKKPRTHGGGQGSYAGIRLTDLTSKGQNANAMYSMSPDPGSAGQDYVTITGVGTETGKDGVHKVTLILKVWSDTSAFDVANGN